MSLKSKVCRVCKELLPTDSFYKDKYRNDGFDSRCKDCERARKRKRPPRTPALARAYHIKHKYGITLDEFDAMLVQQNYKCLICFADFHSMDTKEIHIDHCHTTDNVRGILCRNCNLGLGYFRDDVTFILNAADYIKNS